VDQHPANTEAGPRSPDANRNGDEARSSSRAKDNDVCRDERNHKRKEQAEGQNHRQRPRRLRRHEKGYSVRGGQRNNDNSRSRCQDTRGARTHVSPPGGTATTRRAHKADRSHHNPIDIEDDDDRHRKNQEPRPRTAPPPTQATPVQRLLITPT